MASVGNIRPFIQKWEGGLSRQTADNASSYPAPWTYKGVTGWHTNKGVTYKTFSSLSSKLGYANTAENFFAMPDDIWDKIFYYGYWKPWGLDGVKSQAIADFIANASWGSGLTGSFNTIKKYLATKNISVSTKEQAVAALNKISLLNEKQIFTELIEWRNNFFRSLSDFSVYGKGWLNRSSDLFKHGLETIAKKKTKIVAIVVILTIIIFCIYKQYYKKLL